LPYFCIDTSLGTLGGTVIINMNNEVNLKVNFEELPEDHQTLITKAAK
jgi:tRNA A37 threonylcarbamoyladenosine modification protein TsaB